MPHSAPSRSSPSAESSMSCAARAPARSTGSCPVARRHALVARPRSLVAGDYSDLAASVTGRLIMNGWKIESTIDRWLDARIAPPDGGMCSRPVTSGRQSTRRKGPASTLDVRYLNPALHVLCSLAARHSVAGLHCPGSVAIKPAFGSVLATGHRIGTWRVGGRRAGPDRYHDHDRDRQGQRQRGGGPPHPRGAGPPAQQARQPPKT